MTTLMPIGGNENHKKPVVLQEFVRRAGGEHADIVIFPQPSILADTGKEYASLVFETRRPLRPQFGIPHPGRSLR